MIELTDIREAAVRIAGRVVRTPLLRASVLSDMTGADVFIKFENHQFTASFKERGALNKLLTLDPAVRAHGVVAMSAGNHAQGVAFHARRLGVPAIIVMPRATPLTKVENTRTHGAEVVLVGDSLADAARRAAEITAERGLTFVHPYDDRQVIAGAGTVGLEMLQDRPGLDTLIVPIGGGGLISGIATAAKALDPAVQVIGVQAARYPAMHCAFNGAALAGGGSTIAEGIAVKYPGELTQAIVRACVDEVLLVDEQALEEAVALYLNIEKTVAEGAGAAALACLLSHRERFRGRSVGLVLSGGNIDPRLLASILVRELMRERRIVKLRIAIADQPGLLARISTTLGEAGANILEVQHQRSLLALSARDANVEVTFEAMDAGHADVIVAAVCAAGFDAAVVSS
ncbi:threonine ammonia-lyase [Chelatococcus reniformis]|uniref:Threonine ammonia-lyase n=1 Tax=Chelatococcus reniformis TaxID=1494448 RepID=A0A916TX24_9HYPH|nr:threonine ammonia-lyase [Chelatococcus reniformis]GGC49030.1 threonine ammonia-lyase [Chelatococcus reniformis]